jgi:hypothetical protein
MIIIDDKIAETRLEEEDKKIKPRTIIGSIVGGGIAAFVGGVLWGTANDLFTKNICYTFYRF